MNIIDKNTDDYCDIYKNKICDNCGSCLEKEGIDVRAINIDDIAKTIEENEFLESEYKKSLDNNNEITDEQTIVNYSEYDNLLDDKEEYLDAFENVEYIEDMDFIDDSNIDEMTIELYPGIRKIK